MELEFAHHISLLRVLQTPYDDFLMELAFELWMVGVASVLEPIFKKVEAYAMNCVGWYNSWEQSIAGLGSFDSYYNVRDHFVY